MLEAHTLVRKLVLVLVWIAAHFALIRYLNDLYWSDTFPIEYVPLLIFLISAIAAAEVTALAVLAGIAKGRHRNRAGSLAGLAVACGCALLIYAYFLVVCVSWALFKFGIGFLTPDLITAFVGDVRAVWRHFTFLEILVAVACLTVPAPALLIVFAFSPRLEKGRTVLRGILFSVFLVASVAMVLRQVAYSMSPMEQSIFRVFFGRELLPTISLFWSPLIPREQRRAPVSSPQELVPRYSLQEYKSRIQTSADRPSIIFVVIEALRSDAIEGRIQDKIIMPRVLALSQEGIVAKNVFAQSSESAYSMTSIVTGLYPMKFGTRDTFKKLAYPHTHIADVFKAAGYRTGFFSSANERWQNMRNLTYSSHIDEFFDAESARPEQTSFDSSSDSGFAAARREGRLGSGKLDDALTVEKLQNWIASNDTEAIPIFAFVSLQASHFPYEQGQGIEHVFSPHALSAEDWRQISFLYYPERLASTMRNRYYNSLRRIDTLIGQLHETLQSSRHYRDAVLVVSGDHGELFHEHGRVTHGSSLHNTALAVPVVFHGLSGSFSLNPQPKQLIDIAPTLLEIAKLPAHDNFQGRSMFSGTAGIEPHPVYSSIEGITKKDAVVLGDWKLMYDHHRESTELYNIAEDWNETSNRQQELPQVMKCLWNLLNEYRDYQLHYYATYELYSKYFPPRYLPSPQECSTLLAGTH